MNSFNLIVLFLINIAIVLGGAYKVVKLPDKKNYLPVRNGPDIKNKMVNKLKLGQYIYATETVGGWKKFCKGYVRTPYLELVSSKGTRYETLVDLNFREGPSTNQKIRETLKTGTGFRYLGRDPWNNEWAVTNHGYCKAKGDDGKNYIVKKSKPVNTNIELKTTPYYQCDFGDATYGPNGCSLCRSGCLVTSLTMMYNQVKGTSYIPTTYDDLMGFEGCMASKYVPSGTGLDLQSNLSLDTALNNLLGSLKNNHIAVFGSVGSRGSHFIAVYGYTGDYKSPLKAQDFLIHDPSHKDRTRLSEHVADHPDSIDTFVIP